MLWLPTLPDEVVEGSASKSLWLGHFVEVGNIQDLLERDVPLLEKEFPQLWVRAAIEGKEDIELVDSQMRQI